MILDENEALALLEANQTVPNYILTSREKGRELFALTEGDNFIDELINQIEHIESSDKAAARKKYSRDITHFYERLLRPTDNVYTATGGSKQYDIKDSEKKDKLMNKLGRVRSGKSLQEWLKATWMPLYHNDPNGIIFMEYVKNDVWPTYKNIDHIRNYAPKGQLVDWLIFEPKDVRINKNTVEKHWRIVDDLNDRRYKQDGSKFTLIEELSFEHPFGQVPALINSDIEKLKGDYRLSPIDKIVELSKEYAMDQSVKSLHKKYNGFATMWKYADQCKKCMGVKRDENGKDCSACDGHGYYKSKDVTDEITLKIPEGDETKLAPDIAGYIVPPIEIWKQYNDELVDLYKTAYNTHWGTLAGSEQSTNRTATEIILSSQPIMDRLGGYSDIAEMMEGQLTEWIYNFIDASRVDKLERIASIHYGRRFIIDPPDVILEKYEKAKKAGDNNVILDRLLNEFYTAKYKSDPEHLRIVLLKSDVEPYVHLNLDQVIQIFGTKQAQRKVLFEDFWKTLTPQDMDKAADKLRQQFDNWFNKLNFDDPTPPKSDGE